MKKNIMQQLLLAMLVVLVGTLSFTSCSDSNDESQTPPKEEDIPKRGKPDGYDALACLQSAIVWEDSVGNLVRNYGEPLPGLDPNEEHLFIGVETLEEARGIFNLWLTPDAKVTTQTPTTTDVTVELTDTLGKSQGELFFKAVTDGSAIAEVTTTAAVKHFSKITFIPKSAWPSNAKHNGLYVKGDIVEMEFFYGRTKESGRVIKKQNFVCIRAQSEGIQPFFLGISAECPQVYWYGSGFEYIWEDSNLLTQQQAEEASKILREDWNLFVNTFRQAGAGELIAGEFYWYNEYHFRFFYRELFGINLSTGDIDWFEIQNWDYDKHALYGIFTDLYIKKDPIDYVARHWDSGKNCLVSDTMTIKEYYTIRGDRKDEWFGIGNGETYVIKENVSCKCLNISGNANLIICDGAELKVEHINVDPDYNATLNIYSGPRDAGRLIVDAREWDDKPGIGVSEGSNVVIHGGYIEAYGSQYSAGIGGGKKEHGGGIVVYGGDIKAYGGEDAAGIGGGEDGRGANITIYGGKIAATARLVSSSVGAGIGGGQDAGGGIFTMYGGDVYAEGGYNAAGIGGGEDGTSGPITIYGGKVVAKGGDCGAGIGSGFAANCNTVTIYGGDVEAYGGNNAAGIGTGQEGKTSNINSGTIDIRGGKVYAEGKGYGAGIGAGREATCGTIGIGGGRVDAHAGSACGPWSGAIGSYHSEHEDGCFLGWAGWNRIYIGAGMRLWTYSPNVGSVENVTINVSWWDFVHQRPQVAFGECNHVDGAYDITNCPYCHSYTLTLQ